MTRYVTDEDPRERYRLYCMRPCAACDGTGKREWIPAVQSPRCPECRGEGRLKALLATTDSAEGVGTALVTLAREGELGDCGIGILDTQPEPGGMKWLVRPWQPSTRNVSDAARVLARSKGKT